MKTLKRISVEDGLPEESGKYLVETVSTGPLQLKHRVDASVHVSKENGKLKHKWDLHNQTVVAWYKPVSIDEECEHRFSVLVPNGRGLMQCVACKETF